MDHSQNHQRHHRSSCIPRQIHKYNYVNLQICLKYYLQSRWSNLRLSNYRDTRDASDIRLSCWRLPTVGKSQEMAWTHHTDDRHRPWWVGAKYYCPHMVHLDLSFVWDPLSFCASYILTLFMPIPYALCVPQHYHGSALFTYCQCCHCTRPVLCALCP